MIHVFLTKKAKKKQGCITIRKAASTDLRVQRLRTGAVHGGRGVHGVVPRVDGIVAPAGTGMVSIGME